MCDVLHMCTVVTEETILVSFFSGLQIGSSQYHVMPGRYMYTQRLKDANINDQVSLPGTFFPGRH
jgi:hypothetical protein